MHSHQKSLSLSLLVIAALLYSPSPASAQAFLGTAQSFRVLGGSTVTNTGPTVINGSLGLSPGSSVTGFPPGLVNGATNIADAVALQAKSDITTAYNALAAEPCDRQLTGTDLGGLELSPGVYCFSSSAQLTGTLTLNAQGDPNARFVFQIGSTLTTASSSTVAMINGGGTCNGANVFWQVGSSATLGTSTTFVGHILALTSIGLNTAATVSGSAYARNGAVTLDTNTFIGTGSVPGCSPIPTVGGTVEVVETVVDFQGRHGGNLNGILGGIDWGHGQWSIDTAPCGACPPNLAFFRNNRGTCRSFTFETPSVLQSFRSSLHSSASGTLRVRSFTDAGVVVETFGPVAVTRNACRLYETGFTLAATSVEICSDRGWELSVDNVTYDTVLLP